MSVCTCAAPIAGRRLEGSRMQPLPYLTGYAPEIVEQVRQLLAEEKLGAWLLARYPETHQYRNEKALYEYAVELKNRYMRQAPALSKVVYDPRLHALHNALGIHRKTSRIHGSRLSTRNEIRVATVFRKAPLPFLDMILIHELAHFKETEHNRAFYQLCRHMAADYDQLELDARLYLTYKDCVGELYEA
jgi:predicted metal-dependent hydrolase